MVVPTAPGAIVLVPFPFSDLSQAKLRPRLAVADAGRGDWILCQITSKPYGDPRAVPITAGNLRTGSLRTASYVRPAKLFTASEQLMVSEVAVLDDPTFDHVVEALIDILRPGRQVVSNQP